MAFQAIRGPRVQARMDGWRVTYAWIDGARKRLCGYGQECLALLALSVLSSCGGAMTQLPQGAAEASLQLGAVISGSTRGAGNTRQPSCAPPGAEDVRFHFVPPSAGWFRFRVEADYDAVLTVVRNGIEAACNDDGANKRSAELVLALEPGVPVDVVVDGYGSTAGRFRLSVTSSEEPVAAHLSGRLSPDTAVQGAVTGEPDHFRPSCGSEVGTGDQVWGFVPQESGLFRFRVAAEYDSVVALYNEAGEELGCNDDHRDASTSQLDLQLQAGIAYQVVVDGYGSNQGAYTLTATRVGVPTHGGTPGGGILTVGQSVTHSTQGSTDRYTPNCGATAGSPDHVWELTPTEAGTLEIALQAQFDGLLAVYDSQGVEVVCNDDDGPSRSLVVLGVVPGQRYLVVVDGYQGGQGAYELVARAPGQGSTPTVAPTPDGALSAAQPLSGSTEGGVDHLVPGCGSHAGTPDQIWSFRVPRSGRYRFRVDAQFDSVLALFDDNWAERECNDDHGSTSASEITTRLRRGQTVYLVVDGYGDGRGAYTLRAQRLSKRDR